MSMTMIATPEVRHDDLTDVFRSKYGEPATASLNPRRRYNLGYFSPDDYYEATLEKVIQPGLRWLDVGGGRDVFPMNPELARKLAARAARFVGVDPSPNILENPFVHERIQSTIEDYNAPQPFDVITLRMVAEHITDPPKAMASIARLLAPGGKVVIYTINRWTPISLAAWLIPFKLHHPIKNKLWMTQPQDTFPVAYKMNTRRTLRKLAAAAGLSEDSFQYLDDCRTLFKYPKLHYLELLLWRCINRLGLRYPENCLLGIYRKA